MRKIGWEDNETWLFYLFGNSSAVVLLCCRPEVASYVSCAVCTRSYINILRELWSLLGQRGSNETCNIPLMCLRDFTRIGGGVPATCI